MNIRFFSVLMLALTCWAFTSCDEEEMKDGPTPDNPPISSKHKYVCTKWVADSVSEENNHIISIEFLHDGLSYISTRYDADNQCYIPELGYIDITKKVYHFFNDATTGVIVDNNLIINDSITFTKDTAYVAPMYDNELVGYWNGDYMDTDSEHKIMLNILDNERLIAFNGFNDIMSYRTVSNYTYDNESITFNGKTYPLNGKEIITDYGTYKFISGY